MADPISLLRLGEGYCAAYEFGWRRGDPNPVTVTKERRHALPPDLSAHGSSSVPQSLSEQLGTYVSDRHGSEPRIALWTSWWWWWWWWRAQQGWLDTAAFFKGRFAVETASFLW